MAVTKSGASSDLLTIDPVSKAARHTLYDAAGRELSPGKQTFLASGQFTPAATPTDLVLIGGSATKVIRVYAMLIATTNTAAGSQQFLLVRRSTANTVGTFVAATAIPLDSANAAATAVVGHYTANPTLGTTLGTINTKRIVSPAAIPASFAGIAQDAGFDMMKVGEKDWLLQPVTLRGLVQQLAINFAGVALVAGQTHAYTLLWSEE